MAQAASGNPVRFLTLTINPSTGNDPEERLRLLANAWRITVKRIRRLYGPESCEYLAVVEETKLGEPHLHILLRSPYLPQRFISRCMSELIDSPIVDIRAIKNPREVVRYIAKYITKAPKQFGHAKRYWCSQRYDQGKSDYRTRVPESIVKWTVEREDIHHIVTRWIEESFACRKHGRDQIIGIFTTYEMRFDHAPPD